MKILCTLIVTAAALVAAAPASAGVEPAGTGEPLYTNSTGNTQWFSHVVPSGTDDYRLRYRYYENSVLVHEAMVSAPTSGTTWANWSGVRTLQEGSQYGICVQGEYSFPNDSLYFSDGPNSCSMGTMIGKRSYTTIDRTKPTVSVTAAGGAEAVKQGQIPVSIGFQDATAGPYPSTFLCVEAGTGPCEGQHLYSSACSQPSDGSKNTTFSCTVDASALPDGPVKVCAQSADASVPDNPSSADQSRSASQANISNSTCDTVLLDRNGPQLTVTASKTAILAGESVAFAAAVSDAVSGVDENTHRWEFSDGAAAIAGNVATRTFDKPGTYLVTFRATDAAGNQATSKKTITVTARPGSGGGTATPPPSGGSGTPGTPGPAPVTGTGSLKRVQVGDLTVLVPKKAKLGKAKKLVLGARARKGGKLTIRLTRGKKVLSRLTARLSAGESKQRLRLPRKLKAGTYSVKISFKANGTSWSATGTAKLALKKAGRR
jgi:hypothetical protein